MKNGALVFLLATSTALAQGSFQNLDFEAPNAAGLTNLFVAFADAFPGWTGHINDSADPALQVGYNFIPAGSATAALVSTTAGDPGTVAYVIDGKYSAIIASGHTGPTGALASASISQIGTIPPEARSIRFSGRTSVGGMAITFNGINVPFFAVGSGSNYELYAGDLTPFAGLTGELRFTELASPFQPISVIDNIVFSSEAIPEPGALALLALGTIVLMLIRKRTRIQ